MAMMTQPVRPDRTNPAARMPAARRGASGALHADLPPPPPAPANAPEPKGNSLAALLVWGALLVTALVGAAGWLAQGTGLKTRLVRLFRHTDRPAQVEPPRTVYATRPVDGEGAVRPDASLLFKIGLPTALKVRLAPETVNTQNVRLVRASDGAIIPAVAGVTPDGRGVTLRPESPLSPGTRYTATIAEGVKDDRGVAVAAHHFSFTTAALADASIRFEQVPLPASEGAAGFTCVVIGPDHRLYAGADDGRIFRFAIEPDGTLAAPQIITSLQTAEGGPRLLIGFCFDPCADADDPVIWASHTRYGFENVPDWTGKITRLSGRNLETVQDAVVGLPRSCRDHVTNQPTFGPDGALYLGQGSNTSFGAPDPIWLNRPQHPLTSAVLRLDTMRVTPGEPLDVRTPDGGGSYDPAAPGAPLTVYAFGVRQAYDLVWHSNGHLYVPVNGSSAGGNTPAGNGVPALTDIPDSEHDWLLKVIPGRYYGHPNASQGHYVLNGGNPTAGEDPAEVPQYPVGTKPDPQWVPPAYDFGNHVSADGAIEYQSSAFTGQLKGKLLVCRYNVGSDLLCLDLDANGDVKSAIVGIAGTGGLVNPLDVIEDVPTGNLYVSEYGARRLTLLRVAAAAPQP